MMLGRRYHKVQGVRVGHFSATVVCGVDLCDMLFVFQSIILSEFARSISVPLGT